MQPVVAETPQTVRSIPPRRLPKSVIAALLIAYFVIAAALPVIGGGTALCNNDFGGIFMPSARFVLAGRPWEMYSVRIGLYPNANGPFSEFVIAGVLGVGRSLGLQNIGTLCVHKDAYPLPQDSIPLRIWLAAVFAIIPLGIGAELLRLADKWRPTRLEGWKRLFIWGLILISPPLWDSLVFYGHYEQLIEIYVSLLAVRFFSEERFALSGLFMGMALLNRTAAIFVVIPLAIYLLGHRSWQGIVRFGGVLGATVFVGLLPFIIYSRQDIYYSLTGFRSSEPILDGSIWTFARGTQWEHILQPLDSTVGMTLAAVVTIALLWYGRVRANEPAFYGVICASVVCFSLCLKAVWGYYFAEPLIWGLAWTLASQRKNQPWWDLTIIPGLFTLLMILTEIRISLVTDFFAEKPSVRTFVLIASAAEFLSLFVFEVVVFLYFIQRSAKPLELAMGIRPSKNSGN